MLICLFAFLIGVVAGLRSMTAPAAVSWAARWGFIQLGGTSLSWLGSTVASYAFALFAFGELITDKLPFTPSRKALLPFAARVISGAFCGAAIALPHDLLWCGVISGALGAVAGTLGGYEFRSRLVQATGGKDWPIALLEDGIAVASAAFIVSQAA